MDSEHEKHENGKRLDQEQTIKVQKALGALVEKDAHIFGTLAVTLAWMAQHTGASWHTTGAQLQRRVDYFAGLDGTAQAEWVERAQEFARFFVQRIALIPEIQKLVDEKRIVTMPINLPPDMPRLPGSGGE